MARRRVSILALIVLLATLASASISMLGANAARGRNLDQRENQVWISALRQSQFSIIPHAAAHASCEVSEPPEALATPDPLVERSGSGRGITVSFIVGTDGRVHSLFILDGDNPFAERTVLKTVRSWRYRPAKCNGVPVDAEARIEFRLR